MPIIAARDASSELAAQDPRPTFWHPQVVAGGDQQRAGAVLADPKQRQQLGCRRGGEPVELGGEGGDLGREGLVASGEGAQRELGCGQGAGELAGLQRGRDADQLGRRPAAELFAQLLGGGDQQRFERVDVWVRALIAVARATRSERIISTWPVPALGVTVTWPACTARAAASASSGSDLPWRRRADRSGRLTSSTTWPAAARKRARAAP